MVRGRQRRMSSPLQEKAMLPFRWVFPLEFAQLQKFPRDMPTGQPDLDSPSLRLSFQVTLDCGLLTKLAITVPVLFNIVFHVAHVYTDLEKKDALAICRNASCCWWTSIYAVKILKVAFAHFSGFLNKHMLFVTREKQKLLFF